MADQPLPDTVQWPVHISTATRLSGLSARMIRHYESQGLLPGIARSESGYRLYDENDIHALRFKTISMRYALSSVGAAWVLTWSS